MREGRRCKGAEEGKNEGRKEGDIWKRSFCVEGMSEGLNEGSKKGRLGGRNEERSNRWK